MAQLTQEQIKANINAMEQQGAKPPEVQAWLDSLKNQQSPTATANMTTKDPSKSGFLNTMKDFAINALPTAGAIAGGIGGAALGGLVSAPTVFGIPAGAYAGGVVGSGAGAAAGMAAKEKIQGQALNPGDIGKTGAEYGAMEAIGGPILSLAGKGIEAAGAGIAKMFIPKSEAEAGLLQAYKAATPFLDRVGAILGFGSAKAPSTAGSAAFDKGLMGTESMIGVQAKRAQNTLWDKLISPALKQSNEKVDMKAFFTDAEKKIVSDNTDLTRRKVLLNALDSIKEDYTKVGKVGLEKLQGYKEGWAQFVPEKAYKGESIAGAANDVRNTLAGMAREKIYNTLGDNVKQAYLDYGNLHGITALGRKAMTGAVKGGTGTTLKNLWEMATVPTGTIGGQAIYKVGQGLEIIGKPGARVLRDALGIPLGFGSSSGDQTGMSMSAPAPQANTPPTR